MIADGTGSGTAKTGTDNNARIKLDIATFYDVCTQLEERLPEIITSTHKEAGDTVTQHLTNINTAIDLLLQVKQQKKVLREYKHLYGV